MKKLLLITIALIGSINCAAQEIDKSKYGNVYIFKDDLLIGDNGFKSIKNSIVFTKGSIKAEGEGGLQLNAKTRIYYRGTSDIKHPYIIPLKGKVNLYNTAVCSKYPDDEILILDGVEEVYKGPTEFIRKDFQIKRGFYDVIIKGKGTYKNVIIK